MLLWLRFSVPYLAFIIAIIALPVNAEERAYHLSVSKRVVNLTNKPVVAYVINGDTTPPVLQFKQGDMAVVTIDNQLDETVGWYWQGLFDDLQLNDYRHSQVASGQRKTFRFSVNQAGSFAFYAHTAAAKQRGLFGAIVVEPSQKRLLHYDHDAVIQLSDWIDQAPSSVLSALQKDGFWFNRRAQNLHSVAGYYQQRALSTWWQHRQQGVAGLQLSDDIAERLLVNGRPALSVLSYGRAGDVVRLRLLSQTSSSDVTWTTNTDAMTVIAAGGDDVEPVSVRSLAMATSESYDVLVTIPASGALQLQATSVTGRLQALITIGQSDTLLNASERQSSAPRVDRWQRVAANPVDITAETTLMARGGALHREHIIHADQPLVLDSSPLQLHEQLVAGLLQPKLPLPYDGPIAHKTFHIRGNAKHYSWSIHDATPAQAIWQGDRVRLTLVNHTEAAHSLHLQGHRLAQLTANGELLAPKQSLNLPAKTQVTVEFMAEQYGDWLLQSQHLYRRHSGLAQVITVLPATSHEYAHGPSLQQRYPSLTGFRTDITLGNQLLDVSHHIKRDTQQWMAAYERGAWQDWRTRMAYRYAPSDSLQWLLRVEAEQQSQVQSQRLLLGFSYPLPFAIDTQLALSSEAALRVALSSQLQFSPRWHGDIMLATDEQWRASVSFQPRSHWAIALRGSDISPVGISASITF